ncbi:MAG TPA: bifunctional helix-turn-helix transcriptional regulator/GNAT family N-acetyltransferase [Stellaceae bacterium]
MAESVLAGRIDAVRRFNRFYTRKIGVLEERLLRSPFSLAEARVVYELGQRPTATAGELARELVLDPGYLSRLLGGLEQRGIVAKAPSPSDGRQSLLSLTAAGRKAFAALDAQSAAQIGTLLAQVPAAEQARLVAALGTVERLLEPRAAGATYVLRPHQPGDMGWIVHRHGALYAQEFGWDESFEALVAEIAARFIETLDAKRERCWLAEQEGEILGSVLLVKQSPTIAKLRLLLVEPKARGLGIGARLVDECIRFAPLAGYRKITLWTQSILVSARRIYERAGFRRVREEPHRSFGHDLVGEHWELKL